MNGIDYDKKVVGNRFCILLNDLCEYSDGHAGDGLPICPFPIDQFYLLQPKYGTECPNLGLMNDKMRGVYESRTTC